MRGETVSQGAGGAVAQSGAATGASYKLSKFSAAPPLAAAALLSSAGLKPQAKPKVKPKRCRLFCHLQFTHSSQQALALCIHLAVCDRLVNIASLQTPQHCAVRSRLLTVLRPFSRYLTTCRTWVFTLLPLHLYGSA